MAIRNPRGTRRGYSRGTRGWTNCVKSMETKTKRGGAQNNRSINRVDVSCSTDDELFMDETEEFSNGFVPVSYGRGKRQRVSSGGRSNSDISKELSNFENMSTDDKLNALFKKLTTTEVKIDSIYCSNFPETVIQSNLKRIKLLEYKSIDIEARSRRRNLIFRGIDGDEPNENCFEKVRDIIFNKLCIEDDMYLERAHRLGPRNIGHRNRPRPVIVAFRDYYDTELILEKAFRLKGSNNAVSRDYPQEISSARKSLWGQFKEARSIDRNRVQIKYPARLVVNGNTVRDCFPDWDEVMQQKRIQTEDVDPEQAAPVVPRVQNANVEQVVESSQSQSQSQSYRSTGARPKDNMHTKNTLNVERHSRTRTKDSVESLSCQVQCQRNRSKTRSFAQVTSQKSTAGVSAPPSKSGSTQHTQQGNRGSDARNGNTMDRHSSPDKLINGSNTVQTDSGGDTVNG